jgi:predicted nucleotide-binding protein
MDSKMAEAILSNLMRVLLPDASPRTQVQQFDLLSPTEREILREISERLGFPKDLPSKAELPAVLDVLSRELSDVVLSKANVEELERKVFNTGPALPPSSRRPKPRVFIASSREGLEYADALRIALERSTVALASLWTDEFTVVTYTVERLIRELGSFDFAVFLLTADDLSAFRGRGGVNRANILFEAGLFVGRLGVNRTFFVAPRNKSGQAFSTDLAGLLTLDYDPSVLLKDEALAYTTYKIAAQIQRFGPLGSKDSLNTEP